MQGHLIRFSGAIIIVISCFVIGLSKAIDLRSRKNCLENLISSLNIISVEISSLMTPTPEIFKKLSIEFKGETGNFYSYIYKTIQCQNFEDLSAVWTYGVQNYLSCLSKSQQNEIVRLSNIMGKYDGPEQALNLKTAISHLERELIITCDIEREAMRLYCGVGLCTGLMIAFALI